MSMYYDERNRSNLDKLADCTKAKAYEWYAYLIANNIEVLIYETIRTKAKQAEHVKSGASQTMKSYHIVGQALDFVPTCGAITLWGGYEDAKIKNAIAKAKTLGFEWGGDWKSFIDKPHLQFNYRGYGTDTFTGVSITAPTPFTQISSGNATIKSIQTTLNSRYAAGLLVDGIYGSKTNKALVRGLQTELNKHYGAGLVVDGDFGPRTKAAIRSIKKGDKGNLVYILQAILYAHGFSTNGVDGIFGNGTETAVKSYQNANKLEVDGIAGKNTFAKLFS